MSYAGYITIILDRSGSMEQIRKATIAGVNKFFAEQKKLGQEILVKLVQFDDFYEVNYTKKLSEISDLDATTYVPRGSTALLDAQGRTIDELGRELAAMPEQDRPKKVIVVTVTDGLENASTDFTTRDIADKIKHQREKYNWEFVFLGANQDAIKTASLVGILRGSSLTYAANSGSTQSAWSSAARYTTDSIGNPNARLRVFTEEERAAAVQPK